MERRLRIGAVLVALLFVGCAGEDTVSVVELNVSVSGEPGSVNIEKSANNGTSATDELRVTFDFLGTESSGGALTEYWLNPGDGGQRVSVNAAEASTLFRDYDSHGVFQSVAGANDSGENSAEEEIRIIVHGGFYLNQTQPTGVDEPADLHIDAPSENSVESPHSMSISSTITNVQNLCDTFRSKCVFCIDVEYFSSKAALIYGKEGVDSKLMPNLGLSTAELSKHLADTLSFKTAT